MHVGIVTLFNNNYGSALQCYALKKTIENNNYYCSVLEERKGTTKGLLDQISSKTKIIIYSFLYKGFLSEKIEMRKAMDIEKKLLSDNSKEQIRRFIMDDIKPVSMTWKELKTIGRNSKYRIFIVGSDQVWNASRNISPFFFLKFAPINKRYTYAVSFGASKIPKWNLKAIKNGIEPFSFISLRESSAITIATSFGKKYSVECDPTLLLTPDEWRDFYNHEKITVPDYLLVHFLNEPSKDTIQVIKHISEELGLLIVCFGYSYEAIINLHNTVFIDGDPRDYVAMIDNSCFVCTDSFHTTLFCISLNKDFYVFERQYLHKYPQSARIIDLLDKYGLKERMFSSIDSVDVSKSSFKCNEIICEDREKGKKYIESILC